MHSDGTQKHSDVLDMAAVPPDGSKAFPPDKLAMLDNKEDGQSQGLGPALP